MKLKHVFTVFKKEFVDILRDRRTIITSIVVPMVLIPVLNLLVGGGAEKFQKDITENITVALASESDTAEIREFLTEQVFKESGIKIVESEDPLKAVREEEVRAVIRIEDKYKEKLDSMSPFTIEILFDRSKTKSDASTDVINYAVDTYNRGLSTKRLESLGLSTDILTPAVVVWTNVAKDSQAGNIILMMVIPMMIGIFIAVGGIPAATDLVAGEKERNTFEPLLTTRPSRISLLLGKYLTVTLFSFVSVAAIGTGMIASYVINPMAMGMGIEGKFGGLGIPGPALMLSILITVLLGMTFAGFQLAISTFARSFKEAQTYLSFLIFIAMIPGYATMFMQPSDIQSYMFFIPVLNTISALKMVLGGIIDYGALIIAAGTSAVYVLISIVIAAWMFNREEVLFRS